MDTMNPDNEFEPRHLVRHWWKRRVMLLAIPVLAFAGAYIGASASRSTRYESRATIIVQAPPRLSAEDRTPLGYSPPAFRRLFTADATLDRVRQAVGSTSSIESWRGRFSASTSTEVDNTVSTEFAPTVDLRVSGSTAEETVTLMQHWTTAILADYGDLYAQEAQAATTRGQARAAELATQYAAAVSEEETHRLTHQSAVARAQSVSRLLDGQLPTGTTLLPDSLAPYGFTAGAQPLPSNTSPTPTDETPSLFVTRLLGDLRNAEPLDQMESLRRIQQEAIAESASAAGQLAAAAADRMRLEHALRTNASAAAQAEARFPLADASAAAPGTLRLLSSSVEPGGTTSRAPHITALGVAVLAFLLSFVVVAIEAYVRFSLNDRRSLPYR